MPRVSRKDLNVNIFHVVVQGIERTYIFEKIKEKERYYCLFERYMKESEIDILAFCLMDNHAHFLVKTKRIEQLSKAMQRINTSFALYYNKKHQRVGHVFRNRFLSEPIYTIEQLHCCISYIHNNPVKAKIVKDAREYPYSSCKEYRLQNRVEELLHNKEDQDFIEVKEINKISTNLIIKRFCQEHEITKQQLIYYPNKLKQLALVLKKEKDLSYREIAKILEINREKLRKILKKEI